MRVLLCSVFMSNLAIQYKVGVYIFMYVKHLYRNIGKVIFINYYKYYLYEKVT